MKHFSFVPPQRCSSARSLILLIATSLLSFVSAISQTNAQLYERVHHPPGVYFSYIEDMVFAPNGEYYVVGQTTDRTAAGGVDYAYVAKHNANGQVAWEQQLPNPPGRVSFASSIDIGTNGNLYVCGQMNGCDFILNEGFVTCMTPTGNQVWRNDYVSMSFDTTYHFSALTALANGSIAVGFDNRLLVLDAGGTTLGMGYQPCGKIWDMVEAAPNHVVAGSMDGLVDFQTTPPYTATLYPTSLWVDDLVYLKGTSVSQDQLFFLSNQQLFRTDFQFTIQDSLSWPLGPGGAARELASGDNSVWAVVVDTVFQINPSLQIIDRLPLPAGDVFYPSAFDLQPNPQTQNPEYLVMAGTHGRGTLVQSMDLNGNHNSTGSDLELVSTRTANEVISNGFSYDFWATIANQGPDTVDVCRFFAFTRTFSICGMNWIFPEHFNLNLYPGDTVELYLGNVNDQNTAQLSPQNYSIELCVLAPNKTVDHVSDNNCRPLTLDAFYVGVEDGLGNLALEVFPNPVADQMVVELRDVFSGVASGVSGVSGVSGLNSLGLQALELQVYDLHGKLIYAVPFDGAREVLDMSAYPAGIYFLRVGSWVEKVVKE